MPAQPPAGASPLHGVPCHFTGNGSVSHVLETRRFPSSPKMPILIALLEAQTSLSLLNTKFLFSVNKLFEDSFLNLISDLR